jgi:hypothetical protein
MTFSNTLPVDQGRYIQAQAGMTRITGVMALLSRLALPIAMAAMLTLG